MVSLLISPGRVDLYAANSTQNGAPKIVLMMLPYTAHAPFHINIISRIKALPRKILLQIMGPP